MLDPHANWQCQMAERDLAHEPAVDSHSDAAKLGVETGDLLQGHDGDRLLREQSVGDRGHSARRRRLLAPPGPLAAERRRSGGDRWSIGAGGPGGAAAAARWRMRADRGREAWKSEDPDSERVWWSDAGVHQNMTFPVHPDPMERHALLAPEGAAGAGGCRRPLRRRLRGHGALDRGVPGVAGEDAARAGPGGLRRPLWLLRPYKPAPEAYRLENGHPTT